MGNGKSLSTALRKKMQEFKKCLREAASIPVNCKVNSDVTVNGITIDLECLVTDIVPRCCLVWIQNDFLEVFKSAWTVTP